MFIKSSNWRRLTVTVQPSGHTPWMESTGSSEAAVGIVPPRPHVKLEERREAVPVRAADELEPLPFQHRRRILVMREPRGCVHNELDANQPHAAVARFVYQGFRVRNIDLTIAHQIAVDVMHTHGAVIRTADTAECRLVGGAGGRIDIDELARGVLDELHEPGGDGAIVTRVRLLILRGILRSGERRVEDDATQEDER
jgi:hypothetical protein